MARVVDEFPPDHGTSGTKKYPWDDWLDGKPWLLTPGDDFTNPVPTFRAQVHAAAKARNLRARVASRPEGLYVQALPREDADASITQEPGR